MNTICFKTGIAWAFCLLSFTTFLISCSSDDNEQENTEQNTDGRKLRQLTITDVPITRATLTDNNTSLGATWNAGDVATYFNLSSYLSNYLYFGTLTSSKKAETSTFTGNVNCTNGDKIALFYPATDPPIQGDDRGTFAIKLSGQKGTLEDIATNYHYVYGVGEVTATTENPATATATIASMKSLLAVCKFTFKENDTKIPVKELTICYGNDLYPLTGTATPSQDASSVIANPVSVDKWTSALIVTLENEKVDGVYVALFPVSITSTLLFKVTNSAGTYTGIASAKLNAGKYYPVTLKLTKNNN